METLLVIVALGCIIFTGALAARVVQAVNWRTSLVAMELRFPTGVSVSDVSNFIGGLSGLVAPRWHRWLDRRAVVFEVQASHLGIRHFMLVPREAVALVQSQLRAVLPGVVATEDPTYRLRQPALAGEFGLSTALRPLRTAAPEAVAASILASLQPLGAHERCVMQWTLAPIGPAPAPKAALRSRASTAAKPDPEAARAVRNKHSAPVFEVSGRIGVEASPGVARARLRQMTAVHHSLNAPGAHLFRRRLPSGLIARRIAAHALPLLRFPLVLNAAELSALVAWPLGEMNLPGLRLDASRRLLPESRIASAGACIGVANAAGSKRDVCIAWPDTRRHALLLGPTGTGKSTLIIRWALQAIHRGIGVISIDPKVDTNEAIAASVDPDADVVIIDPVDEARPVGVALLEAAKRDPELAVDQIIGVMRSRWQAFWGPRTDFVLRHSLRTLLCMPEPSLCDLARVLTDPTLRRGIRITDPSLIHFWAWFDAISRAEQLQVVGPVLNKIDQFTSATRVRNTIGQRRPRFDFATALAKQQTVLISLAPGVLGTESASLLGSLLFAALWWAVSARVSVEPSKRPQTLAFIDEAQHFVRLSHDLGDVLAEARALNLGLVLATQQLAAFPPELRSAVMSNCASRVLFQLGSDDARVFGRELAPHFEAQDLRHLGAYDIVAQLAVGPVRSMPVTATTFPPAEATGNLELVKQRSRERYGVDAAELDADWRAQLNRPAPGARIGRAK